MDRPEIIWLLEWANDDEGEKEQVKERKGGDRREGQEQSQGGAEHGERAELTADGRVGRLARSQKAGE